MLNCIYWKINDIRHPKKKKNIFCYCTRNTRENESVSNKDGHGALHDECWTIEAETKVAEHPRQVGHWLIIEDAQNEAKKRKPIGVEIDVESTSVCWVELRVVGLENCIPLSEGVN